jgi:hypothetical protein
LIPEHFAWMRLSDTRMRADVQMREEDRSGRSSFGLSSLFYWIWLGILPTIFDLHVISIQQLGPDSEISGLDLVVSARCRMGARSKLSGVPRIEWIASRELNPCLKIRMLGTRLSCSPTQAKEA